MKKEMKGQTLGGESRYYTFEIMDAETGLELFYKYCEKFLSNEKIRSLMKQDEDGNLGLELDTIGMIRLVPSVLPWEDIKHLASKMLVGAWTEPETGEKLQHDEKGFSELMVGDPMELFTALFYAVWANYPKYIDPLLGAVDDDSSQGLTIEKKTASESK